MQRLIKGCVAGVVISALAGAVLAQPKPAADTTKTPAPPARKTIEIPAGYEKVTIKDHNVLCEPNDVAWVKKALDGATAPKPVEGGPDDMIKKINENRAAWAKQIATDLAMDDKTVQAFIDDKVIGQLNKVKAIKVPIYYLVVTPESLKSLSKTRWGEPKLHYNGVADAAAFDDNLTISIDQPMDDQFMVAFYNKDDKPEDRTKGLINGLQAMDTRLNVELAGLGVRSIYGNVNKWLDDQLEPLKLNSSQSWFKSGLINVLASKYSALFTGVQRNSFLAPILDERHPLVAQVPAQSIDLLNLISEKTLREEMVPFYNLAVQRKGTVVVLRLIESGGEAAVPKSLAAIRQKKPADGKALVETIKEATSVDLTKEAGRW